ncbi:ABC transporter substrate-binding protein [Pseudogemmobacter humi]|uniref:Putrescine-binding periplasmic protein n=1 Tax=Pseudogemmobacter humi TaxID=2483812 RepID=A0A3P5XEH2_9RHOB|nr:extracellular solute-binding protein [Pseudogemmobacter humi]VDC28669.1 Putrescine-binding periplasmic protein precursor [Pseudogemmobacter humi]
MKKAWTIDEIKSAMGGAPSRRQLLAGGSAAVAGAFMAPFFPGMARAEVGGRLKLLAWESMPMQSYLAPFLEANGIDLEISSIATQDDVHVQLIGNTPNTIDVTSYSVGYSDFYINELGIVSQMDPKQVPAYNEDDIFAEFYMTPAFAQNGEVYAVPVIWGLNTLVYNPALVPEPASYTDLLKPEYAGQLTFIEDTLATWPMLAKVAGFGDKFPHLTREELAATFEAAIPYRAQSKLFAGSVGDTINLFVNGEIGVLFCGWAGIPTETGPQGVETIAHTPAEGGAMWCDAWFIPKTATNRDTAHAFINAQLTPEGNAATANHHLSGCVNRRSVPLLNDEVRASVDYDNLTQVLTDSPLVGMPPRESDEFATFDEWTAAWEDFKLGF